MPHWLRLAVPGVNATHRQRGIIPYPLLGNNLKHILGSSTSKHGELTLHAETSGALVSLSACSVLALLRESVHVRVGNYTYHAGL